MSVDHCINLDDLRRQAKRRVPKLVFDFIEGGVDSEDGLARNEEAFEKRALVPRYMVDISVRDQTTALFGCTYAHPFGIAPTGGVGNYRRGGDLMLARAARDANIPFIMSGASSASMEAMAAEIGKHGWYQLYSADDREISYDMIRRAKAAGIPALVVTVDVPITPNRERNRRNGFGRPLKLTFGTKLEALRHPRWMRDYLRHGIAMLENWQPYAPKGSTAEQVGEFMATQTPTSLTWTDVERYRSLWDKPLILKGIMRVDDARCAAEIGVDGLIVSNHGGRQLDRAPAPLDVLPAIDAAVGERMTLMLDGGIRRGADVLIALASGAKFVWLGRPTLYGCVAGGQAGAAKAVTILRDEADKVMAQIGCPRARDIGPEFLLWEDEPGRNFRPGVSA